jgi:integrase
MPYKEKSGTYRGQVVFGGKVYTKRYATKTEAKDWETEKRRSLRSSQRQTRTVSLHEAATEYLTYCEGLRFNRVTIANKKKAVKELLAVTGNIALEEVEPGPVLQEIILKQPTASLSNERRKHLHAFFAYCRDFHGLRYNPITPIKRIPQERVLQKVPTDIELAKIKAACRSWQDRAFITIAANTGARRSELFALTWADVDFQASVVRFGNRKNRMRELRFRDVPLNQAAYKALQQLSKQRLPHSDYVFQNRDGRHPGYGGRFTARRKFMAGLCKSAKIQRMGFHSLRRYFASKLVENREDLETVRDLLGHQVVSTTDKYVYRLKADVRAAVDRIEKTTQGTTREGVK